MDPLITTKKNTQNGNLLLEASRGDTPQNFSLSIVSTKEDYISSLSEEEKKIAGQFPSDKRRREYAGGRTAALRSARLWFESQTEEPFQKTIRIGQDVFAYPYIICETSVHPQLSISHNHLTAAALTFPPGSLSGIDIEFPDPEKTAVYSRILTPEEKKYAGTLSCGSTISRTDTPDATAFCLMWTLKEALSKAVRTGFTVPPAVFSIKTIETKQSNDKYFKAEFTNFSALHGYSFIQRSQKFDRNVIFSVVLPQKTVIKPVNISQLIDKI